MPKSKGRTLPTRIAIVFKQIRHRETRLRASNLNQKWETFPKIQGRNHQPIARPRCISLDTLASAGEKQHLHHSKVSIMAVPINCTKATNWAFLNRTVTSPAKKVTYIVITFFSPIHRKHHLNPGKSDLMNILNSHPTKIGERVPSPQRFYRCRMMSLFPERHGCPWFLEALEVQVSYLLDRFFCATKRGFHSSGFISSTNYRESRSYGLHLPAHNKWNMWTPPALDKGSIKRCMTLINKYSKKLHFTVFNTFESQTCDTHRYSNAGILHESTDVIFFRPMFLSMHSLQLRVCP